MTGDPITYSELLYWIGLWVMVLTVAGSDHRRFWSTRDLGIFDGSFFTLSNYMTRTWFENILNNLTSRTRNHQRSVTSSGKYMICWIVGTRIWPTISY